MVIKEDSKNIVSSALSSFFKNKFKKKLTPEPEDDGIHHVMQSDLFDFEKLKALPSFGVKHYENEDRYMGQLTTDMKREG